MTYISRNVNGQATMANSEPVVIASNQTAIPITGSITNFPASQPIVSTDTTNSGTITAVAQNVAITLNGKSGVAMQIIGTWVGTLQFEGTVDGTNWVPMNGVVAGASTPGQTTTTNGIIRVTPSGMAQVRINATSWTSGTATISIRASDGTGGTFLNQSLTAGANVIGKVGIDQTTDGITNAVRLLAETTKVIGTVNIAGTVPVTGTFFQATQPVSLATNTPDVTDRNTRQLGVISAANLDVALSTRLKPADTLAAVTLVSDTRQTTPANLQMTATPIVITKGTQSTTGFNTQDLKDAGRNQVHYYTIIPVLTSGTDTLQSLTGTKAGVTVTATATPAVVTTGKTFRVTRLSATYIATAVSGYGIVRLRFNTAGLAAINSPIAATLLVGAGAPTTANSTGSVEAALDEGWEFAAATGVGISVQGFAAVTGTAVGYVLVSVTGYEY